MDDNVGISIVGDNELSREGLKRILTDRGFTVECLLTSQLRPARSWSDSTQHIIIVDAASERAGLEICRTAKAAVATARVVLLSDECRPESVRQALSLGVDGFLVRQVSCEPLVAMLRLIALGEKVVPTEVIERLIAQGGRLPSIDWREESHYSQLSEREVATLRCLVNGDANKIISRRLGIAEATVKVHIKAILRKLDVLNRTQAAIWAVTHGLDDFSESNGSTQAASGRARPRPVSVLERIPVTPKWQGAPAVAANG